MSKNFLIGFLIVVCLLLFVYAMVQKTEAVKSQKEALANAERAMNEKYSADKARAEMRDVEMKRMAAVAALDDCMRKKK